MRSKLLVSIMGAIVAFLTCILMGAFPTASMAADAVEEIYHYVGEQRESSGSDLITFFNFDPREDARINVEVIDLRGETRYQYTVPKTSQLVLRTSDLGITDLYYLKVASSRPIAMSIVETYYSATEAELGGVTPQPKLYSSYALANGSSGTSTDDFFRIYAPVTPTTIEFYDHNLTLLSTRTIAGNGLANFRGQDLGYDPFSGAFIRASDETPNPFAISFMEGVPVAFLIIPQGIEGDGDVVEVAVRTWPYWTEVGEVDLAADTNVIVMVASGGPVDPTNILFDTVEVEGFDRGALRGPVYHDYSRDGLPDYIVWYRLDRMPPLACGEYDQRFDAMTSDGQMVTGQLRFVVTGCAP